MKSKRQKIAAVFAITIFNSFFLFAMFYSPKFEKNVAAQTASTPVKAEFDQAAALAKLREQIKGKEQEPAEKVFKNVQMLKTVPAGRFLAMMEMGYARSLGVNCTHCHVPEKWEAEDKTQKQIAREMAAMVGTINNQHLKNIKNLNSAAPIINCTTCHRGEVKPALNLPSK